MNGISNIAPTSGSTVVSSQQAKFGDNAFLNLLVTQMRSQTPLDPIDNQSFMEQLASFSSMEEQKQLNDNMLKLLDFQGVLARLQGMSEGSALLGKSVTFQGAGGTPVTSEVKSVFVSDGGDVRLRLNNGEEISTRQITAIAEPEAKKDTETKKDESSNKEDNKKKDAEG